ncbi:MAG TPA: ABC transporter permease [Vitreimonas sp.]|uniref:ABC transporter permease n=1 Tax=Vitreimonas sp. TaxID=3069702 RepID=UPI002D4B5D37|nr:ABC transporter permease [Vitreimonas sp.]HYD88937.1 ABC transporter permease [Vitreimonas sp.]
MSTHVHPAPSQVITEIRPDRGWLDLDLGAVWRYRELLGVLVMRDLQVLYKQALLGAGWAILQPVFAVIIFSIIFGYIVKMPSEGVPYPLFAFAGVLPWTYFAEAVRRSGTGLVTDAELVRKVYFPRLIMPLANVISPLVDFCIAFVVLLVLMAFYGIAPSWKILVIPPLMVVAALLALSIGLWLGPINVRFRDIKHTLPFLIQIWMYASPIVYPLSIVPREWQAIYALNPMVGVIEGFRWAVFDRGEPNFTALAMSGAIIVLLLAGGLVFFRRMERTFADVI